MNFPTDVNESNDLPIIVCLCTKSGNPMAPMRGMGSPKGGPWDFNWSNCRGHRISSCRVSWTTQPAARSVLNHNGNWEKYLYQSVWCHTRTDWTTSELTERLQNEIFLPKRPTPRPHTSNFPNDVSKRNFVAETDYRLIAHRQL